MPKPKKSSAVQIKHPFFQGLSSAVKSKIFKLGKVVSKKSGKTIFRDGDKAQHFFLIIKGKVNLIGVEQDIRFEAEAEKRIFQTLGGGDVVGWSWVLPPYRWRFDVETQDDTEFFMVNGARLRKEMEKDHELGYEIYKRLLLIANQRLIASRFKLQMFGSKPFTQAEGG